MRQVLAALAALFLLGAACGDDDAGGRPIDASAGIDASPPGPDASCYEDPQTHFEIINACTDAESVEKNPELPLLEEDGSLPPIDP
jgi:hypothetical protein